MFIITIRKFNQNVNFILYFEFTRKLIRGINFFIMNMKLKVLEIIEENKGHFISGEDIARSLAITRAAVWKNIKELQNLGYVIQAVPHKGYSLANFNDVLSKESIEKNLLNNSKISEVIYLDSIDSTNNYAKKNSFEHGTLIVAGQQTAGRGRFGHTFESPPRGGLYMSLVLRPRIEISKFQMITIADAVAVCLAIEDLYEGSKENLKIKWVNDVFFHDKKIAGILTEAVTNFESGEIERVVTGIGVNVSTKSFNNEIAGSIFDDKSEFLFSRSQLCARIADYIMNFAEDLSSPQLINLYRQRSLLKSGSKITYMKDNEKFSATVKAIDDLGGLMIINDDGKEEILRSGEVNTVRSEK